MSNLTVFKDVTGFVDGAADFIATCGAGAIADRDRFTIALSGGGTPKLIYARLASAGYKDRIDWSKWHIFFGDERCVPPDDAKSNFRMAREAMLDHVPVSPENVYRIRGEDDPAMAALRYEQQVAGLFRSASPPAFDLILLGMGDNGHTASLFPGTAALRERVRWVIPQYVEVMSTWRVTFTTALINAARNVAFMAEGVAKADMLWNVIKGPYQPDVWPSQLVQPVAGKLHWLVDQAAAAKVQSA